MTDVSTNPNWEEFFAAMNAQRAEFGGRFDQVMIAMTGLETRVIRNSEKLEEWVKQLRDDADKEHEEMKADYIEGLQSANKRIDSLYGRTTWFGGAIFLGLLGLLIDLVKNYVAR
jgi:hypothetical protein